MRRRVWMRAPLVLALGLSGCGWHPLYGTMSGSRLGPGAQGLAEISVGLIPERSGQLLRLALQERFERFGGAAPPRYDLSVSFAVNTEGIAILQDNTTTRMRVIGTADWKLVSQDPQRATLTSGTARDIDGYNIINQQYFAADMEFETVRRRVAEAIADEIAQKLATYFDRRGATG